MIIAESPFAEIRVLEPKIHHDQRGFFMETWRDSWYSLLSDSYPFIQDNVAFSVEKGVMRGLHFQKAPHAQSKLVWASRGSVYDAIVDIRIGSPTYGRWFGICLSAENALRLYVPRGFAHGYMTLEPNTEFHYKVDSYYNGPSEGGIVWNDPALAITWPQDVMPLLSEKDACLPALDALQSPFVWQGDRSVNE